MTQYMTRYSNEDFEKLLKDDFMHDDMSRKDYQALGQAIIMHKWFNFKQKVKNIFKRG